MKSFFFTFWNQWEPDFCLMLELMERKIRQDHEVTVFYCGGSCEYCTCKKRGYIDCVYCTVKLLAGLKLLSKPVRAISLTEIPPWKKVDFPDFQYSIESLKKFEMENFKPGMGVLSSFISRTRNPEPDFEKYHTWFHHAIRDNLSIFAKSQWLLKHKKPDQIFVANGRFQYIQAVCRAAEQAEIPYYTCDFGCDQMHYMLFQNTTAHNLTNLQSEIVHFWENSVSKNRTETEKKASIYFEKRRNRNLQNMISFTSNQAFDKLPSDFSKNNYNIVVYPSSEDEFVAVPDWKHIWFDSQLHGLLQLKELLPTLVCPKPVRLYIRLHPNMKTLYQPYVDQYYQLNNEYTSVISPESDIDSYGLMDHADKIIVFGSTIGLEAAYFGKDVILSDMAFYQGLGIAREAFSIQTLADAICSQKPFQANREMILAFGYFLGYFGELYRYASPRGFEDGRFMGKRTNTLSFALQNLFYPDIMWSVVKCVLDKFRRQAGLKLIPSFTDTRSRS